MDRLKNNLVLALALGVVVYLLLIVFAGYGELVAALKRFDWFLLPAIIALVVASYAVRFLRWSYYLGLLGVDVPVVKSAAIFVAGLSMTVSPGKLGEVFKSVFVRRVTGAPIARTAPAVVAERVTDGTGMVAWGLLGGLAFGLGLGGLLLFLALAVLATAALRSKWLSLLAERSSAGCRSRAAWFRTLATSTAPPPGCWRPVRSWPAPPSPSSPGAWRYSPSTCA